MLSLSPPGQASSPALLAGGTKSLLACSGTAGADAGSFPTLENPSPSSSSERDLLMLPPWPCCFWVAHGETGPSTDALPIPASRHFHRAGAKLRSLGMESGLGGQKPAPAQGGGGQDRGLRVPCPAPTARATHSAPNQPLGFNTPEPPITCSFPSSFTYVNDDPQEVIVGERRELASLDLLNHFITGTRSEWPFSAGSASPSPSPFI